MPKFAVIGLGRFGKKLAEYLVERGAEVLAIDRKKDRVEKVKNKVRNAVILDSTNADSLKSIGVNEMDVIIVGVGENFEASVLTVALAKKLGVKHIIAKASTDLQGEILGLVGADEVVYPEDTEAERLARVLMEPHVIDHIQITGDQSLVRIVAPAKFIDRSIVDLKLRNKYGVTVLEILRNVQDSEEVITAPAPDFVLQTGDTLVVIGKEDKIKKFRKICAE